MSNSEDNNLLDIYKLLANPSSKSLYDIVQEKRAQLDISDLQMAKILDIDKSTFNRLIKNIEEGNISKIDFFSILKICHFLGIDIKEMSQIYVASLNSEKVGDLEYARKARYIIDTFDIKTLKDKGFINTLTDFNEIERRIVSFFRLDSIYKYTSEIGAVLFSKAKGMSHDKMREFWVRSAFHQFEKIQNPNLYEREKLLAIIPKIRAYTRFDENGFLTVLRALYNVGVTVIVQSYLSRTQVKGGTFVVSGKPCIVITDFKKTYASLWQTLLHELYHVIYDFEELLIWKYHLTGEAQSEISLFKEPYADYFATELLLPPEKLKYITPMISVSPLVAEYAKENGIHESIIYFYYCADQKENHGKDYYGLYQHRFGSAEKALSQVRTYPWNKTDIYQEIDNIKRVLTTINN